MNVCHVPAGLRFGGKIFQSKSKLFFICLRPSPPCVTLLWDDRENRRGFPGTYLLEPEMPFEPISWELTWVLPSRVSPTLKYAESQFSGVASNGGGLIFVKCQFVNCRIRLRWTIQKKECNRYSRETLEGKTILLTPSLIYPGAQENRGKGEYLNGTTRR
ncbi:hypothetical protein RUM44_002132 [Polyplax serrata]|uniref:Uncharacterized protein n=1 Tax=Polyplax serrata TaxID=468196 RepID=A0ABR1ALZ6_POLSC